jgi:hypothetical protein
MTPRSTTADPRHRFPRRGRRTLLQAASVVAAVVVAATLAGCGIDDAPLPPVTVTVTPPDDPTTPTDGAPTSVPTSRAPGHDVPTSLAAGHRRGAPASFAEARARLERAPAAPGVAGVFRSPTGNIFCDVSRTRPVSGCEVAEGRVAPPVANLCPPGGPADVGRIELTDDGAVPVCSSDTIRDPAAPPLPYGTRTAAPGSALACLSESVGVTCLDSAHGHGFFLARGTFVTF